MSWLILKTDSGRMYMDARDVYGILERKGSKDCDIHTTLFPDGITVRHSFDMLVQAHTEALSDEDESETDCDDLEMEDDDPDGSGVIDALSGDD